MKKYLAVLFLIFFQGLSAQVQFEARVSKQNMGINERLRIDFTMNEDGDNFTPPSFEGFRVVGGPSQQVSQTWVNGRGTFNKSYIYFLLPLQKGTIVIKSASIEIKGEIYKTAPIKITVGNAVQEQRDPSDPNYVPSGEVGVHLVAEVSKANPYLNEGITVVYKLYVSHNVSVRNWRETSSPKFNDFWSQNIEIKDLVVENGKYKGEDYRYVVLRKAVLYPQKAGKLKIEPLSLDMVMEVPTNRRDIFGRPQLVGMNKTIVAETKFINVKALPEAGKPDDFTGAVGKFTFTAKPTKTELKHGESLDLEVSVSGNGNLKLFTLPKPIVPSALEMYDPVHTENVTTPLSGMQGKISDKYTLIPQYKGNYPIKGLSFSYFDPSAGRYKTLTSPEIMVKVLDGPTGPEPVASNEEGIGKHTEKKNVEFANIKLKTNLVSTKKAAFFGTNLYYGLLALPFILIPIIVFIRRRKEARDGDIAGNKRRMSNRLAKKYLSQAKKQINNKEPFYIALERALHNFLKAKLHIETSEMSKEIITEILLERGAKPETVKDFINLTENCEFARYAPFSSVAIKQDYEKAVTVISELEKQI
ncbi:BatD family protein [uncultured Flavobacterium sp.]|uniref:BatD family protein n=1 Tax=uncultured Flavobacterium sp. TaxID=165435 RepID=UPI0025D3763A|nr:BatD family protein [uncultured Flavobacterium sp.]